MYYLLAIIYNNLDTFTYDNLCIRTIDIKKLSLYR